MMYLVRALVRRLPQPGFRMSVVAFATLAVVVALGLASQLYYLLWRAGHLADRLATDVTMTRLAGEMDMMHDALRADVLLAQLTGWQVPEAQRKVIEDDMVRHVQTMRQCLAQLEALAADDRVRHAIRAAQPDVQAYIQLSADLVRAAQAVGYAEEQTQQAHGQAYARLEHDLAKLGELIEAQAKHDTDSQKAFFASVLTYTGAGLTFAIAVLAAAAWAFIRTTLARLGSEPRELSRIAHSIADGDLTANFAQPPHEGSVGADMVRMQQMLGRTVVGIRGEATSLAAASDQIASSNAELAARYDRQLAALGASASNMEVLGSTVAENAESAMRAHDLAQEACTVAQTGGDAVSQVVDTMGGITRAARRIGDITGLIDSIAFQTNILALNAAVEAARAGEAGRGFAVVAGEVRGLARRSAEAAREIRLLSSETIEAVQAGASQVDQAGATVRAVVEAIQRVTRTVSEISDSSFQQTDGVQRLSMDVGELQRTTESNAVMVQEGAVATSELSAQAQRLLALTSAFSLPAALQTDLPAPESRASVAPPRPVHPLPPSPAARGSALAGAPAPCGAAAGAGKIEFF